MNRDVVSVLTAIAIAVAFCVLLISALLAGFGGRSHLSLLDSLCMYLMLPAGSITFSNICGTSGMMCLKAFGIAYPLAGTTPPPTANSFKIRYFQIFFCQVAQKNNFFIWLCYRFTYSTIQHTLF